MAGTNQFYPHATGSGANVLTVASWLASNNRQAGFQAGIAKSVEFNTALRQSTSIASIIGGFIADQGFDALDNADLDTLRNNFEAALRNIITTGTQAPPGTAFWHYGDAAGTAGAVTADVTPDISAYTKGFAYSIRMAFSSVSGGTTVNFDGKGQRPVIRADGTAVQAGDWVAGQVVLFIDDGASIQLTGVLTSNLPTTGILVYTSSSNYTIPPGVTKIKRAKVWGAGGGGGGSTGAGGGGSGAGGGGYQEATAINVVPGQLITIIVGTPGQGGSGANGTNGGTSSIALQGQPAVIQATGGGFGSYGNGVVQNTSAGAGGIGSGPGLSGQGGEGSFAYSVQSIPFTGIGGAGSFGGGSPTPNVAGGYRNGNFPGGGANGGVGGSMGGNGGGGLVILEI